MGSLQHKMDSITDSSAEHPCLLSMLNSLGSIDSITRPSLQLVAPKLSRCLATIEANLISAPNSEKNITNSGELTYDKRETSITIDPRLIDCKKGLYT